MLDTYLDFNRRLLYLAGLFDGEGYIGITKVQRKGYSPIYKAEATVTMREWPVISMFLMTFGGTLQEKPRASEKHARCYKWAISGDDVGRFVLLIEPYLIAKKPQAILVGDLQAIKDRQKAERRRSTPEELVEQERLYQKVKELNTKGVDKDLEAALEMLTEFQR